MGPKVCQIQGTSAVKMSAVLAGKVYLNESSVSGAQRGRRSESRKNGRHQVMEELRDCGMNLFCLKSL